ncbi:D-arabinose 1-dehydrogenase-like Zn-dependent alcohol dehydrogenase [Virgibacillus halotolerans]|uniref:alcohol dehydrogenase catalytic domain-containing protein n=1 Tax=Virgibacillus halotolerans TaxID=1071053 RepID=UPI001960D486|nr:alcohol dehydrogenase catalytic domain-containing protein [Virgibacillus halotolerans]MBM7599478.1 D-arabinose 1-dehydrogenase-like Zn-dependent alcohol dehydrogenase [Virgibacillus halotolerans]
MKALFKVSSGPGNLELLDVPEPECKAVTIKIQVRYAGICGADLHISHDTFPHTSPVILWHEFSEVVTEVGKQITKVKPEVFPNLFHQNHFQVCFY